MNHLLWKINIIVKAAISVVSIVLLILTLICTAINIVSAFEYHVIMKVPPSSCMALECICFMLWINVNAHLGIPTCVDTCNSMCLSNQLNNANTYGLVFPNS